MNSKLHIFLLFFFVIAGGLAAHLSTPSHSYMPGASNSENVPAHLFVPVARHRPTPEEVASFPELVNQAAHGQLPGTLPSPAAGLKAPDTVTSSAIVQANPPTNNLNSAPQGIPHHAPVEAPAALDARKAPGASASSTPLLTEWK